MNRRRGFTLMELIVAVALAGMVIFTAVRIAESIMRNSGRATQTADLGGRARLLGSQIRADVMGAGLGSTGAVGADCTSATWAPLCTPSARGTLSIPAVRGSNDVSGSGVLADSDAVQIVVPDPSNARRTVGPSPVATAALTLDGPLTCPNSIGYISDHSSSNGSGRTQLIVLNGSVGNTVSSSSDVLMFTVAEGSDVMCARVTTYWVDDQQWLHRSDRQPGMASINVGGLDVTSDLTSDVIAPGIADLQIAYRFSSELAGPGVPEDARWAYSQGGTVDPAARGPASWFETRRIRVSMLVRSLRAVETKGTNIDEAPLEDRASPVPIDRAYSRHAMKTEATVMNLRMFDLGSASGQAAEPY